MIKAKKIYLVLEFNQSQWLKQYVEFNTQKRIEADKNVDKNGKALCKSLNNVVYGKTMENLRNGIDGKTCKQQKRLFKMDIQIKLYVTKKIDNYLVSIRKNKVTLRLKKPAYIGMCIL